MMMSKAALAAAWAASSLLPLAAGGALRSQQQRAALEAADGGQTQMRTMAELYPFYHSTEDIRSELQRLAGSCAGLSLQSVGESQFPDRQIDVVTMRAPGSNPVNKNFLLFGEHSRELISPESGLHFIRSLCGETDLSEQARSVLQDSEFQIVVNANPASRRKVEGGDFCLRVNPNGVDLNRNWDEEWSNEAVLSSVDTNPGPMPFSEPETRTFRDLVDAYRPTTFLTIHSGTKGMYMPWAYDMEHLAKRNQPQMMQILKTLDKKHCECPFGAAGREVGYSCPGTCLDWVYDKLQTPYAFAFEIYIGTDSDNDLRQRWQDKMAAGGSLLQTNATLGHEHFKDLFEAHPSCFVQLRSERRHARRWLRSASDCFMQFNPSSASEYQQVVENWSGAYLDMATMVVANLKSGGGGATNNTIQVVAQDA